MRGEYWPHLFWLVIISSWALGFLCGMVGVGGFPAEIGRAVSIPSPEEVAWWQAVPYFLLAVVSMFVLSHLFFGAGSAVFTFFRGINDCVLLQGAISIVSDMDILNTTLASVGYIFFVSLVLVANLPLSLWAAHLGAENSMKALYRMRGKPWRDWGNRKPVSNLLLILGASVAAGLAASIGLYMV